jgi:Domain of unknown function (DUF4062)
MEKQPARKLLAVISSTALDLPVHRNEAFEACLRQDVIPTMIEQLPAIDCDTIALLRNLIDTADIYIGILGFRYGYVPNGHNKSITEIEYDHAMERGIQCLMFLMSEDHPVKPSNVEMGEGAIKLEAFKKRVRKNHVVNYFDSPQDLRAHIINSLSRIRIELESEKRQSLDQKASKQRELLHIFVASPSDVKEERSRMPKVVESLNRTLGKLLNVVIELWRWETDATPGTGEPQSLIDPELDQADIVVVIFWNRFGMPTQAGTTGTEGEVLRSLERWKRVGRPQVMMYFCQRPELNP